MFKRPDDDEFAILPTVEGQVPDVPSGPAVSPAPEPASDGGSAFEKFLKASDESQAQKRNINLAGAIGDILGSGQSFGNFYTGKMAPENHSASKFASTLANSIEDPLTGQQKAFAYLKQKREMGADQSNSDPNSTVSKAKKALALKYNLNITPEMSGYDVDQLMDSRKMNETQAQSTVEHNNRMDELKFGKNADREKMREQEALEERRRLNEIKEKMSEGGTEGRKAVDKDFAKDYNEWNGGGFATAQKNLQRLRDAKAALKNDPSLTGSFRGLAPDWVRNATNEKAITTRDDVRAAAQGALKATLGSQFTEKEGERIMNQAYNERLSPQANIDKIDAAIKELEGHQQAMLAKSKHFEQHGSLRGFETPSAEKTVVKKYKGDKGSTKVVYSDGSEEIIPSTAGK
jgi:hypothetical protein